MKILFDQGTPRPLRRFLARHEVKTSAEMGWSNLDNGALLSAAEGNFDVFITTDKNLRYQQNLAGRRLAILVLQEPTWRAVRANADKIHQAIDSLKGGEYVELIW